MDTRRSSATARDDPGPERRLLITAGPTHEPIDAVRFIGNRSSGRVGIALADEAARRGWNVSLLLGPTTRTPADSRVGVRRFQSTADLEALLAEEFEGCDCLLMAAAVADYRPAAQPGRLASKHRRLAGGLTLHLESTPDLLAGCAARRRPGQLVVGFALEPAAELLESARTKLARKGLDLIVANPLGTLESPGIDAVVLGRDGSEFRTPGEIDKEAFAARLLDIIAERLPARDRDRPA